MRCCEGDVWGAGPFRDVLDQLREHVLYTSWWWWSDIDQIQILCQCTLRDLNVGTISYTIYKLKMHDRLNK